MERDRTDEAPERRAAGDPAGGPGADAGAPPPAPARVRGTRRRWLKRRFKQGLVGFTLIGLALVAAVTQTEQGQQIVIDELLQRVRGALAGDLAIGEVRSRSLLTGVTLVGVRLDAAGGAPVLEADSVVVRYSLLSLVLGVPRVRSTVLYGLDLEISRYAPGERLNVQRILTGGDGGDDGGTAERSATTLQLGRIGVQGGTIRVLTPAADAEDPRAVPGPEGYPLRELVFDAVDLDLEEAVVRPGGAVAFDARLASLTAEIFLREQPLVVHEAAGDLTFGTRGLEVEDAAFRLPGTLLEGRLAFGPRGGDGPWVLSADLSTEEWGALDDLAWIDERIPSGRMRGAVQLGVANGIDVTLREVDVELEASRVSATGRVRFADVMTLRDVQVTASPLLVSRLEPWIDRDLPVEGFVSGRATFSGTLDALAASGRLTLVPTGMGGTPTTAEFAGTIYGAPNPGAESFEVSLDPINYRVLAFLWPEAGSLAGGSGTLRIDGRADDGIAVVADLTHESETGATSRVFGTGSARRSAEGVWATELQAELAPLALPLLGRLWPDLELTGQVAGPVAVSGPLDALRITGRLSAAGGSVDLDATVDLRDPASGYRLSATTDALALSELTGRVPAPTMVTGRVALDGAGFTLDSLRGRVELEVRGSRVGDVRIDSLVASARAADGLLMVDTLTADASGVRLTGGGSLGMVQGAEGQASFAFGVESLLEMRPVFMGDSLLTRDGLNALELDLLRARGIDPDTLPEELDVRMAGALRGTADVRGRLGDLDLDLLFEATEAAYGRNEVDSARVALRASGLPATLGDWDMDVTAAGVTWADRDFERVRVDGTMSQRRGEGTLEVQRRLGERYYLTGAFALDSLGGVAELAEASIQIADFSWVLGAPTRIAWNGSSISIDTLELEQLGPDPMHVLATGTLTRGGDSNFRLEMEGFHVEHALSVLQLEELELSGHVDLSLTVLGPAEQPVINALFQVQDPVYGAIALTRLNGSLEYADRVSDFRVDAWDGERRVLTASGTLPLDLALTDVEVRSSTQPMDVDLTADSLDAAVALAYLNSLRDVTGTVSADVHIGGTSRDPEPEGTITLSDAAWTLEALGVRHSGVAGEIVVRPDLTVGFTLETTQNGRSTVAGVVRLEPLTDPTLDLGVTFERFQAVNRRDMQGTISGEFRIRGTYRLPVAEGTLQVDEGTLFVDEFARAAGIVDLSDPTLFADGFAVDTTVFVAQPVLAGLRNPFLDNLRVDIDLSVPRNVWLRSSEMDVEMGGELLVRYDRREGDLVLVGDLQALRGSYAPQVLGRTFEVQEGTVSFLGQPGINPSLDIRALTRIRRRDGDPLEVIATVQGTLVEPIVTLSTEEAGIAQSDLLSYLLFGRASGDLAASGSGLGEDLRSRSISLLAGAAFSQVGAALAEGVGLDLDYLAVSQGDPLGEGNLATNLLATTQLEVGRYFGDDVFVVLVFSKPNDQPGVNEAGGVGVSFLRGVRVELALTDATYLEGFIEDRLLRSGGGGFGASGLDGELIGGIAVFREWGYGSTPESNGNP